jgi:hypothetical protein
MNETTHKINEYNLSVIKNEINERKQRARDDADALLTGCKVLNYRAFRRNQIIQMILLADFFILFFVIGYLLGFINGGLI